MAIFHFSTNTPPKAEIIAGWIRHQPWGPATDAPVALIGSFHLDDPDGEVGMQVYVVEVAGTLMQVPLTFRDTPIPGSDALMSTMEHSVLGTRYVYDGLADDQFLTVLAGAAAAGYGQALGFAERDGRRYARPDELVLAGGGGLAGPIEVDGFGREPGDENTVVLRNDRMELTIYRRLTDRPAPVIGLTATWPGQPAITLVEVREIKAD